MLTFPSTVRVYLAPGPTDMRKSFDTLSALAREVLERDPLSGHLFAFCGRRKTLIKILVWDSCEGRHYVQCPASAEAASPCNAARLGRSASHNQKWCGHSDSSHSSTDASERQAVASALPWTRGSARASAARLVARSIVA